MERSHRLGIPLLLVSPTPSQEALNLGPLIELPRNVERAGWARLEVIDLRAEDPRAGLFPGRIVAAARAAEQIDSPAAQFIPTLDETTRYLLEQVRPGDVVLVLSAGDADQVSARLFNGLKKRTQPGAESKEIPKDL